MIMMSGIEAILKAFATNTGDGYNLQVVEFGDDDGGVDPPTAITVDTHQSEFNKIFSLPILDGDLVVENYKILKFTKTIIGDDNLLSLTNSNVIAVRSIRLICTNGTLFAWRRFPVRVVASGYRITIEWDIALDEMCWNVTP